jgi:hypothetical protein
VAGGDPGAGPIPLRLAGPGPLARLRRALEVPRSAAVGFGLGIGVGLGLSALAAALPYWLLGFGPPTVGVVIAVVLLRRRGQRVAPRLRITLALGWAAGSLALLVWLGGFPKGTFLLPEPLLVWLLPALIALSGLGVALVAAHSARERLRPTGVRDDVAQEFANRLAAMPWRGGGIGSPITVAPDVLGRAAPGWRPFPVHAVDQPGPPGARHWPRRAWLRRRLAAIRPATRVLWRSQPGLVVAVEPPRELHAGPDGLHRTDGPALVWADGTEEYHLRGVRLPRSPELGPWSAEEIHSVPNSEVRRIMIETVGWDEYLRTAELELVAGAPDPGNPPHHLELYELPFDVFGPVRLLVMVNGSPDRTGAMRRYAEFVPDDLDDPVEAAAWQYGVDVEVYRILQRRT